MIVSRLEHRNLRGGSSEKLCFRSLFWRLEIEMMGGGVDLYELGSTLNCTNGSTACSLVKIVHMPL